MTETDVEDQAVEHTGNGHQDRAEVPHEPGGPLGAGHRPLLRPRPDEAARAPAATLQLDTWQRIRQIQVLVAAINTLVANLTTDAQLQRYAIEANTRAIEAQTREIGALREALAAFRTEMGSV